MPRSSIRVFLMAYDEHETSGPPGPIASPALVRGNGGARCRAAFRANKLVVAIGNYAYDWHDHGGDSLDVEEAWQAAARFGRHAGLRQGQRQYQLRLSRTMAAATRSGCSMPPPPITSCISCARAGIGGVALWRLGSEDPGLWSIFGRNHRTLPPASAIDPIPAGTNVDIEGAGEILKIAASPVSGLRHATAARDGTLDRRRVRSRCPRPMSFSAPAIIRGDLALTFDDGPDPDLDAADPRRSSKAKHVPATFFIVGENALDAAPPAQANGARGARSRQPHLYASQPCQRVEPPGRARAQHHPAAVPGVHRPFAAAVPRALFRRRRADHRRRNRSRAGSAEARLYLGRPARRSGRLEAPWRSGDHRSHASRRAERAAQLRRRCRCQLQPQHHPAA